MGILNTAMTYVGGAIGLGGLALGFSFFGRRSADPVAEMVFGPIPFWLEIVGFVAGLAVAFLGLVIAIRLGDEEIVAAALDSSEE